MNGLSFSNDVKKEIRGSDMSNGVYSRLAQAFLHCGSIAEPSKEYHLEFALPRRESAEDLLFVLSSAGINAGITERKGTHVVYIKNSEAIEDFLTMAGAPMSAIELMNIKIVKNVRNKANRIANCDSANIERTLKASEKQIRDIEYIKAHTGLGSLPVSLRNIAIVRLDNPEASLSELGSLLDKPLGRSGVNHRLKRISQIADGLRNN